jgi:hypothetical protein
MTPTEAGFKCDPVAGTYCSLGTPARNGLVVSAYRCVDVAGRNRKNASASNIPIASGCHPARAVRQQASRTMVARGQKAGPPWPRNIARQQPLIFRATKGVRLMKKIMIASAAFALLGAPAVAQNTGAPANAQSDTTKPGMSSPSTSGAATTPSPRGDASTSGAGTAAGPKNTGTSTEPGAVQSGANKR